MFPLSFISDREIWKSLRTVAGITLFTRLGWEKERVLIQVFLITELV